MAQFLTVRFYPSGEPTGIMSWRAGQEPMVDMGKLESIRRWLIWNDPNGSYTDRHCRIDGIEPLTLETARASLRTALAEA